MEYLIGCLVLAFFTGLAVSQMSQQSFQFEELPNNTAPGYNIWRSEASKYKIRHIVSIGNDTIIEIPLCITPEDETKPVLFQFDNLIYSNDGYSDTITISLDGDFIGVVKTVTMTSPGDEWNVIQDSGKIGNVMTIEPGRHTLAFHTNTSYHGVDLDKVRINFDNIDMSKRVFCMEHYNED